MLEALAYAHLSIVHRDIKPENIFLLGEEPDFTVKLLDFGIAKVLGRGGLTRASTSMGTEKYMAPEQQEDAGTVDRRADLYAVGVVLYELLAGYPPQGVGARPSEVREGLDGRWDELLLKTLQPEPSRRPGSAAEMIALLAEAGEGDRGGREAGGQTVARRRRPLGCGQCGGRAACSHHQGNLLRVPLDSPGNGHDRQPSG